MQGLSLAAGARAAFALAAAATLCTANAQPVHLRLAGSLCNSMTNQVLTTQQVPPLASQASAANSVNGAMAQRLEQQRDSYFARLDNAVPFNGLYVTGLADQTDNYGNRYSAGVEWELFNEGRGEARRTLERLKLESKTQYVQLLRDMEERQLQENLLAVEQMRNKLLATMYEREAAAIRPVLERRRAELAAGRATRADVAEIEYKAERAQLRSQHYGGLRDVLVYPASQELINRIEDVQLKPVDELLQRAAERSPDLRLQALVAGGTGLLPSYRDKTSVRLYVERSKDINSGPYNVAGVRVRIPIGNDDARDAAAEVTEGIARDQQDSIRAALGQKLELLAERLRLKQNDMRILQSENKLVRQKAELACYRLDHPVSVLPDADRDIEDLTLRLHEMQREILSARLDVLEVLTQISALVKPKEPGELYSLPAK
jgi:hypothetical protein